LEGDVCVHDGEGPRGVARRRDGVSLASTAFK
jgi:hypothetical protein